jgi:hypothetical protein
VAGFIGQANLIAGTVLEVRDGLAWLKTPLGRLAAPAGDTPPARGAERVLFFRPEAARPAGKAGNLFRGRVVSQEYLGAQAEAVVEAAGQARGAAPGGVPAPGLRLTGRGDSLRRGPAGLLAAAGRKILIRRPPDCYQGLGLSPINASI